MLFPCVLLDADWLRSLGHIMEPITSSLLRAVSFVD